MGQIARFVSPHRPIEAADERLVFNYTDPNELYAAYGKLRRNGVKPTCIIHEGERLTVQYREPGGAVVELCCAEQPAA
jgi:hypothetical protein